MASLIWEGAGWISSGSTLKFRVKMSDGSNMVDSDEGVDFINILNAQDFSKIDVYRNQVNFSLGLGYLDFNYDEFFIPAEEFFQQPELALRPTSRIFASLGNGIGMAAGFGVTFMPFAGYLGNVSVSAMYWEVTNYSCIVEIQVSWGEAITMSAMSDEYLAFTDLTPNPDAQFVGGSNPVSFESVDNYNILIGFHLTINGESGLKAIFPADRFSVDSAIADGRIVPRDGFVPTTYAPVLFQDYPLDYTISILNLDRPQFVNEGETANLSLQIKSQDYSGQIKIYLVDSQSILDVNEDIGDDLASWYGDIGDDVVAQYGSLNYNGQKIITDTMVGGETKQYQISYTANNVSAGQTDSMSIFIKASDDQGLYNTEYDLLPIQAFYTYIDNIEIDILNIFDEYVEAYNPSDTLITQPVDIMHHIFGEELGFDKDNIDLSSKTESRSEHEDFEMGFSINKEIESKKLIQEISQSCKSFPVIANDNLKFITIKNTYTGNEEISTIKADDVFNYSFSRTSVDDIITKVEVKYNKDYGLDTYLGSHIIEAQKPTYFYNGDMSDNFREDNYYGVKEMLATGDINHVDSFLDFESPYVRDRDSAYALAEYLFYWNVNQHNIVELKLPLSYYAFEIGDLIEFDKMMLGKKAYGEKYALEDSDNMPVRAGQYILPLFMITETKKDLDSIKIKAIQLHHMSGNLLTYKGKTYVPLTLIKQEGQESGQQIVAGSGDFNGDGFTDILDVVFMLNKIVGNEGFTDEETLIADVNGDGQVDVLDLYIIVTRITNG